MRIQARDLAAGDVVAVHDWNLHVIDIERDRAVAVLTAEFDCLIHFLSDELVNVNLPTPLKAA
jgi:hypothetical protein